MPLAISQWCSGSHNEPKIEAVLLLPPAAYFSKQAVCTELKEGGVNVGNEEKFYFNSAVVDLNIVEQ
ncbi:hypothetical protein DICVIV_06093 [Dictyocaulus viviparus]|uniref:Uncharacterized protein n=1 Tax=Dictyocaulus viviparus TaxID=29172 RepID=A0A0D8XZQ1_DICVI|nr:hypothetical protein DICVIV_06093 [Dictyocaulus viviparus]